MRAAITIATVMLSATAAQAQFATKYAVSGQSLKLYFAYSTNPDCSSIGPPTIRVTRAPEHGRLTVVQTKDFPNFPLSNPRSDCNRRRVAGAAIRSVSQRGYIGMDAVGVEIIFASGSMRQQNFTINVR